MDCPRCGHPLTTITVADGDGEATYCERCRFADVTSGFEPSPHAEESWEEAMARFRESVAAQSTSAVDDATDTGETEDSGAVEESEGPGAVEESEGPGAVDESEDSGAEETEAGDGGARAESETVERGDGGDSRDGSAGPATGDAA